MRVVFMGTPDFAVPCLKRLAGDGHEILEVYCQPDRPKGRGHRLAPPPVKELALELGLAVRQPKKLRDGAVAARLRELAPDAIVVVAYGRLLPGDILAIPPLGCVNIHGSLLPAYRGAAPIQWAVLNGEEMTGVTSMYMAEEMDAGDMILIRQTPIGPAETAGELFGRLSLLGAEVLSATMALLEEGKAPRIPQNHEAATFAPPITKEMAWLDFTRTPEEVCCWVRGMNPSPGAKTMLRGKLLRVLAAQPVEGFRGEPGQILDGKRFVVACGDGAVEFRTVQPEGKKAMDGAACIRGTRLEGGERCETPD